MGARQKYQSQNIVSISLATFIALAICLAWNKTSATSQNFAIYFGNYLTTDWKLRLLLLRMKKFLVFILAVLYIGSSTGATIHIHYCMGKLVNMSLNSESKKCPKCPSKEKSSSCSKECCKDLHKTLKLEKDQKLAEMGSKLINGNTYTVSSFYNSDHMSLAVSAIPYAHPYIKGPPAGSIVQPYILYRNFRV
ncbi:HYC_CC_PP family protein [Flavitalea antarctica]